MLSEAMAAEQSKSRRNAATNPFAALGIEFKEVSLLHCCCVAPGLKQSLLASRSASELVVQDHIPPHLFVCCLSVLEWG